jgi:RND family efflux transporter MFP subunit
MARFLKFIDYRKLIFGGISIFLLGVSSYYLFFNEKQEGVNSQPKIETVIKGDIEVVVNGSGQIQAESQVDLKPQVAGDGLDIEQVLVENDQYVEKGTLIAVLDNETALKDLRDAELSLRATEISYKEISEENDNKTKEETWKRESAQINYQKSLNSYNNTLKKLEDYKITAPFDGIITGLNYEAGDSISRDDILASMITKTMQAEISLNEIDAIKIKEGDSTVLTFNVLDDKTISGIVRKVDTIGEVNSGVVSYGVVISFEANSELLKPGMSVEVDIITEKAENVLMVNSSAIMRDENGNEFVMVLVDKGKTEKKNVKTGLSDNVNIEIISGLNEGDQIVLESKILGEANSNVNSENSNNRGGGNSLMMGGGRPPM